MKIKTYKCLKPDLYSPCSCGSGKKYKFCCNSNSNLKFKTRIIPAQNNSLNNYIVVPASLFNFKKDGTLSANEITVIVYLLSLYNDYDGIQVTQKCIAEHCGLSVRTIKNISDKLYTMGYINVIQNVWDGRKKKRETNVYILKNSLLNTSGGFFYVPRFIFNMKLTPKTLLVYFFMCHSQNYEYDKSWNSYNDISKKLKLNRGEAIKLVAELESLKLINKKNRIISKRGKGNYYADNRYSVTWLISFIEKATASIKRESIYPCNSVKLKNMIKTFWSNFEKRYLSDKSIKISEFAKKLRIKEIKKDKPIKQLVEQMYLDYPF